MEAVFLVPPTLSINNILPSDKSNPDYGCEKYHLAPCKRTFLIQSFSFLVNYSGKVEEYSITPGEEPMVMVMNGSEEERLIK